jgi:hypothetical protein
MEKDELCLDLWGGSHCVNKNDGIYNFKRENGLFSCLTVITYGIQKFTLNGYKPKNISLNLLEYDLNTDFYNDLFQLSNEEFNFDDIDENEMDINMRLCEPSMVGIGREKKHLNFKILDKVKNKYFLLSDTVKEFIKEIEIKHNIDYSNAVFVWARKTDKVDELPTPDVDNYIKIINDLNLRDRDIILQTDDITVYNEFIEKGLKFRTLNEIPYAIDNIKGFHAKLNKVTDDDFFKIYNMTKKYYLQRILALVNIASKCDTLLIYPGNLATYIPLIRGNWNNVYSFEYKNNLMR